MRRLALLVLIAVAAVPARADDRRQPPEKYAAAVKALEAWLEQEVKDKKLPALSIALVDDQEIVWSRGFGHQDAAKKIPATSDTVYRVGSVSKPVTSLLLMLLLELGLIDLDVPVERYLPNFKPDNPHKKAITLRQLVSHRSGLVRESPVGSYFDEKEPSLAKTVESLNGTALVFTPEQRTSYSNAAVAVAGYVVEQLRKEPFAAHAQKALLNPLGMKSSSFELTPGLKKRLAAGQMWTYHGREFPAPVFQLGTSPAGNLYSTVNDLARLQHMLFAKGKGPSGQFLKAKTLEAMYVPQLVKPGEKAGFGIGFHVSQFEGGRRIGHGGAVYGYATTFAALPDDKLGVVVIASKDIANGFTDRVANAALRQLLAARAGKPQPALEHTRPLPLDLARKLVGQYESDKLAVELRESEGRLYLWGLSGGMRAELRQAGDGLVTDDPTSFGVKIVPDGDGLRVGKLAYRRVENKKPAPPAQKWLGLIGEYGWDHNLLYIHERDGKLYALIEWGFLYPLTQEGDNVFAFPDMGLYPGEKLIFHRDKTGRATKVIAANVEFPRRTLDGEGGKTFRVEPLRPVAELRKAALAAKPPLEKGEFRKPDLVDVTTLDKGIKLDVRYASADNFLGTPLYTSAKAFLQRPAAEAMSRAHKKLAEHGYGLLIHDGYRPWHVTKIFHDATPAKFKHFVADPAKGSRHNRGCAVDLTLYDLKTGKAVEMVSGFDEFSDRAYPEYPGGTSLQRWQRDLLRRAMEAEGFAVFDHEWWHFDYRDWRHYPILNVTFEELAGK